MQLTIDQKDIDKFLMIGDKVLIKPKNPQSQTKTGLYLPPSVQQGEKIQAGYVIKAGPGYPLPAQSEEREVWEKKADEEVRYLPLQAREGDLAVYLQNAAYEITFNEDENTTADLLDGKITFHQYITPFTPAEDIEDIIEFDPDALSTALN